MLPESFGSLTELTRLEVPSGVPSSSLRPVLGLPSLEDLHFEIDEKGQQPVSLVFGSWRLTSLMIKGIKTASVSQSLHFCCTIKGLDTIL